MPDTEWVCPKCGEQASGGNPSGVNAVAQRHMAEKHPKAKK